jgi:hypothetical protein
MFSSSTALQLTSASYSTHQNRTETYQSRKKVRAAGRILGTGLTRSQLILRDSTVDICWAFKIVTSSRTHRLIYVHM